MRTRFSLARLAATARRMRAWMAGGVVAKAPRPSPGVRGRPCGGDGALPSSVAASGRQVSVLAVGGGCTDLRAHCFDGTSDDAGPGVRRHGRARGQKA
jgi:hypothetical protein